MKDKLVIIAVAIIVGLIGGFIFFKNPAPIDNKLNRPIVIPDIQVDKK